jgi:hypothetical protein
MASKAHGNMLSSELPALDRQLHKSMNKRRMMAHPVPVPASEEV